MKVKTHKTCPKCKVEFKLYKTTDKCKKCYPPKPIKRTPIQRSQKPIKPRSQKRANEYKLYQKLRARYLKENELCEARLKRCNYKATEIHHKAGKIGELLNLVSNFLAVCRNCHDDIHANDTESKKKGLSELRTNK